MGCLLPTVQGKRRFSGTSDFGGSLPNNQQIWISSRELPIRDLGAQAHPALHLLEFEAYGTLPAGCGLQLPRLLRAIEQRTLSFQRQGVLDLLMALLWLSCASRTGYSGGTAVKDTPISAGPVRRSCSTLF